MIGSLNQHIRSNIRSNMQSQCIKILVNAYKLAKSDPIFNNELEEDSYTAVLVDKYMPEVPLKYESQWFIAAQVPFYNEGHLNGSVTTKEAPRPDIRFEKYVLSNPKPFKYTIEAKKIKAASGKLKQRYLSTGIDNFTNRRYPDGCLAGYVIKCNSDDCIQGINKLLIKAGRSEEILNNGAIVEDHREVYISQHGKNLQLKHVFLEF